MNNTPQSNRLHVGIFGETNAGKSSLFNALTETDISIVSEISGTTTDTVHKSMELLPFGPIVLIDTAGLGDDTLLGRKRMEKTQKLLDRIDMAIYVIDAANATGSNPQYEEFKNRIEKEKIPHLLVITKGDMKPGVKAPGILVSIHDKDTIDALKRAMAPILSSIKADDEGLLGDILEEGSTVVLVVPIDSAAPKGRIILPQAQVIRDCLDNGCMAYVVTEKELPKALVNLKNIDLVVTDSQAFGVVASIIPQDIKLTSFSILMARQKGDIWTLINGINAIGSLKDNDKILVSEACTHSRNHEDIGRVKVPAALSKMTGRKLDFEFTVGRDYPADLSSYALIVHCGACMITPREMKSRIKAAKNFRIPITNYGLLLAKASGILERSVEVLK